MLTREQAVRFLVQNPLKFAHMLGFTKLTELNEAWIKSMLFSEEDRTLMSHRGSYKSTCVSIAISLLMILYPNKRILFVRKTDNDVKEIIKQILKILEDARTGYIIQSIYDTSLRFTIKTTNELTTNLVTDTKGTSQLLGVGTGGSLTGKHFDVIFTDDIINVQDRISKAERDKTKQIYQELQNIKNRGGRIFNTGTPWHKEDAFTLMPEPEKYDCYSTGLMTADEIESVKKSMTKSLFSCNYELLHIADENVLFPNPKFFSDSSLLENGVCHIDASYGGEDATAFTIAKRGTDGKIYALGKLWHKHVDNCLMEILDLKRKYLTGKTYVEDNGDKGYLKKALREAGDNATSYHETTNKFLKISSVLYREWQDVYFLDSTDPEYVAEVEDYSENAEHDDAPDSLASICRMLRKTDSSNYQSVFG